MSRKDKKLSDLTYSDCMKLQWKYALFIIVPCVVITIASLIWFLCI